MTKKNKYAIVTRPDGDDVSNFPSLSFPMQKTTINKKTKNNDVTKTMTGNDKNKLTREQTAMPCPAFQVHLSQCQRQLQIRRQRTSSDKKKNSQ